MFVQVRPYPYIDFYDVKPRRRDNILVILVSNCIFDNTGAYAATLSEFRYLRIREMKELVTLIRDG